MKMRKMNYPNNGQHLGNSATPGSNLICMRSVTPKEFIMKNLSRQDLIHFNEFLLRQIRLTQRRIIYPLYRGDKLKNIFDRLGVFYDEVEPDYKQLLDRLFMVGEKSRNFY